VGGTNVALSDTAVAYLTLDVEIRDLITDSYPMLLGSEADLSTLKASWQNRLERGLNPCHYAALFLDARKHIREFVQSNSTLIGSSHDHSKGNTDALRLATQFVNEYAK
jgi:hypothetical protein